MDPQAMIRRPVDDLQLDIEARRLGLERERKPNRQRGLEVGAPPVVLAEPAADDVVEPRLEAGAKRTRPADGGSEVANRRRRGRIGCHRRKVVLIAGVPLVDQAVERGVARPRVPVDHGERPIRAQIAC